MHKQLFQKMVQELSCTKKGNKILWLPSHFFSLFTNVSILFDKNHVLNHAADLDFKTSKLL